MTELEDVARDVAVMKSELSHIKQQMARNSDDISAINQTLKPISTFVENCGKGRKALLVALAAAGSLLAGTVAALSLWDRWK